MNCREAILHQIHRYIKFPDCKYTGSFRRSEEVAISRWAAIEIAKAITLCSDEPIEDIVSEFYEQMIRCMQLSKRAKQKRLFKVAADTADEIGAMI